MAIVPAGSTDGFPDLDVGTSAESFGRLLGAQQELFHAQIEQLQRLVVAQCRLTGVNPLAQEMAAGALSIKIGKRPRDLLNPKAIKYMQSVFSIKDAIGKKETREISALCGITATQVRDFFAGQRSRVRKLARLSHEKATSLDVPRACNDPTSSGQILAITQEVPVQLVDTISAEGSTHVARNVGINIPGNNGNYIAGYPVHSVPGYLGSNILGNLGNNISGNLANNIHGNLVINTHGNLVNNIPGNLGNNLGIVDDQKLTTNLDPVKPAEGGTACSLQEESMPGIESEDKKFLENIFNLMSKEETFSGQVKLMEWILQIRNSSVLNWFLTKGGITIISTWLSEAAVEEQTTVLFVIFKVLCHLPLHKALPVQVSAILQTVNKLRFYRTSDISNRARILLSRWSKLFVRNQAIKKPSANHPQDAQIIRKQRISETLKDESWQSKIDIPEEVLAIPGSSDSSRKSEARLALKLLPAASDESSKKPGQSVYSSKTKERRKVLLIENPDRKGASRGVQVARSVPSNQSRPILADDIQKAKMRAMFMQSKYGRTDASTSEQLQRAENSNTASASQSSKILPASGAPKPPQLKRQEDKKLLIPTTNTSPSKVDFSNNSIPTSSKPSLEKLKSDQIQWHTPPAIRIDGLWKVGCGESSKEVEVQTQRIRREKETFYASQEDIPPNPREPWDMEMDFDDSLTPEIPTQQQPDVDVADSSVCSPHSTKYNMNAAEETPASTSATPVSNGQPEPDLELLAVLLKNPELVFALTSGQGNNMNDSQKVALLDMLKKSGVGLTGANEVVAGSSKGNSEPVSLPSPTPPAERNGWRSEAMPFAKTPPVQPQFASAGGASTFPTLTTSIPSDRGASTFTASSSVAVRAQTPVSEIPSQAPETAAILLSMPQLTVTINAPQQLPVPNSVLNSMVAKAPPALHHQVQAPTMYPLTQSQEAMLRIQHHLVSSHAAVPSLLRHEHLNYGHARNGSRSPSIPSYPTSQPSPLKQQQHVEAQQPIAPPSVSTWPPRAAGFRTRDAASDTWYGQSTGLSEVPGPNPHSFANQSNYGMYPKGPVQQPPMVPAHSRERSEFLGGSRHETWSLEGSPAAPSDLRHGSSYYESRREHGWDHRAEQQWNPGHRDHRRSGSSSRKRRDRERRR